MAGTVNVYAAPLVDPGTTQEFAGSGAGVPGTAFVTHTRGVCVPTTVYWVMGIPPSGPAGSSDDR